MRIQRENGKNVEWVVTLTYSAQDGSPVRLCEYKIPWSKRLRACGVRTKNKRKRKGPWTRSLRSFRWWQNDSKLPAKQERTYVARQRLRRRSLKMRVQIETARTCVGGVSCHHRYRCLENELVRIRWLHRGVEIFNHTVVAGRY